MGSRRIVLCLALLFVYTVHAQLHNCTIQQQYANCGGSFDSNCLVNCTGVVASPAVLESCPLACYAEYTNTNCVNQTCITESDANNACFQQCGSLDSSCILQCLNSIQNQTCVHTCQLFESPALNTCVSACAVSHCKSTSTVYRCGAQYLYPSQACTAAQFTASCANSLAVCNLGCTNQLRTTGCQSYTQCFYEQGLTLKPTSQLPSFLSPLDCGNQTTALCGNASFVGCRMQNCSYSNAFGYTNGKLVPGTCTSQPYLTQCDFTQQRESCGIPTTNQPACVESCNAVFQYPSLANRAEVPNVPCQQACSGTLLPSGCALQCATPQELASNPCMVSCSTHGYNQAYCASVCSRYLSNYTCVYQCYTQVNRTMDVCLASCNTNACDMDTNYPCANPPTITGYTQICPIDVFEAGCANEPGLCLLNATDFQRANGVYINQQCFWQDDYNIGLRIPSDYPSMPCPNADTYCGAGFTATHPNNLCRVTNCLYSNAAGFINCTLVPGTCVSGTILFQCTAQMSVSNCVNISDPLETGFANPSCTVPGLLTTFGGCFNGFEGNDVLLYSAISNCISIPAVALCASSAEQQEPCYQSCINSTSARCLTRCMFGWADQLCVLNAQLPTTPEFQACLDSYYPIDQNCYVDSVTYPCSTPFLEVNARVCDLTEFAASCVSGHYAANFELCTQSCSNFDRTTQCSYFLQQCPWNTFPTYPSLTPISYRMPCSTALANQKCGAAALAIAGHTTAGFRASVRLLQLHARRAWNMQYGLGHLCV